MKSAVVRRAIDPRAAWLIITLLLAMATGYLMATHYRLALLVALGLLLVLVGLAFLKVGLYRQLLVFLALLQVSVFAIKVSYGAVNSTLLAMLPTAYLVGMLVTVFLLAGQRKVRLRWNLLDLLVAVFFLLNLVQVFNPYLDAVNDRQHLIVGLRGFWQRSFFGLTYFVMRGLGPAAIRFDTIARVLAYSIALSGLYALVQQLWGFDILETQHRAAILAARGHLAVAMYEARGVGFLNSPFTFGLVSAMGFVCSLYVLMAASRSRRGRFLALACALINGVGVLLSGSRSTLLGLSGAFVILAVWVPWGRLLGLAWRLKRPAVGLAVGVAVLVIAFPDSTPVRHGLVQVQSMGQVVQLVVAPSQVSDVNFVVRQELARGTLPLIVKNPWGYGSGIFTGSANPGLVDVEGYATWTDNEFSSLALELGVVAVFLLLGIVAIMLRRCRRALRHPDLRNQAVFLAILVLVCPIGGFGGQWLTAYPANVLFWVFAGTIAGLPVRTFVRSRPVTAGAGAKK